MISTVPSMLRLFAPRPLLIVSGELDPNCPLEGARLAFAQAEQAYQQAGASDRLKIDVETGSGHTITPRQEKVIIDWLEPLAAVRRQKGELNRGGRRGRRGARRKRSRPMPKIRCFCDTRSIFRRFRAATGFSCGRKTNSRRLRGRFARPRQQCAARRSVRGPLCRYRSLNRPRKCATSASGTDHSENPLSLLVDRLPRRDKAVNGVNVEVPRQLSHKQ